VLMNSGLGENDFISSIYFSPSFLPAESSSIDSRMRLSRVSGHLVM
jgi:hypothetical protein